MSELDRKAIWQPPPRPDWVTRINAEGNCMNIRGVVPLDENSLLDTAMRNTGLSNFGSEEWREPFKVFVKSLDEEAELNLMGRLMGRSDILLFLEARLRIWSHRDPVKAFASGVDLLDTLQWVRSDHPLKSGVENMMSIEGAAATRSLRRISAQRRLAGLAPYVEASGSLNNTQALASSDSSFRYVISARDPGIHHWLDTGGIHEGGLFIRWQTLPEAKDNAVGEVKLVKLSELPDLLVENSGKVSPERRTLLNKKRAATYAHRHNV